MPRVYRSMVKESHECNLALQSAYDRGYEQAKLDYKRPEGQWTMVTGPICAEYRCSNCLKRSFAPHRYCHICGSSMVEEVLK